MYYNNNPQQNQINDYYTQLNEARRLEKKGMRINVSKFGFLLLLYTFLSSILAKVYYLAVYAVKSNEFTLNLKKALTYLVDEDIATSTTFSMLGNLLITLSSLLIVVIVARFLLKVDISPMLKPQKVHLSQGVKWFPLSMTLNIIVSLFIMYITLILNQYGVNVPDSDFSIANPTKIAIVLQLLYVVILGPVVEEVMYRGLALTLLKPYGKGMAIVFSAIVFGVMHGNISQAASAFAGALVYGAIAVNCNSIVPTIIIHILNNLVASYTDIADALNWKYTTEIICGVQIFIILIGVYLLLAKSWKLKVENDNDYALPSGERYTRLYFNGFVIIYFLYIIYTYVQSFMHANS